MPRNIHNCSLMLNLICSMLCKYGWLCISYKLITKTSSCMQRTAGSGINAVCSHLRSQGEILLRGSPMAALPPSSLGGHPGDHSFSERPATVRADPPTRAQQFLPPSLSAPARGTKPLPQSPAPQGNSEMRQALGLDAGDALTF